MKRMLVLAAGALIVPIQASAQPLAGSAPAESSRLERQDVGDVFIVPPGGRTDQVINGFVAEVSTQGEDASALLQFGQVAVRQDADAGGLQRRSWSVAVSAPVGGGNDLTSSSTLDALSNGAKLTLNLNFLSIRAANLNRPAFLELFDEAQRVCREQKGQAAPECDRLPNTDLIRTYLPNRRAALNRSILSPTHRVGIEGSINLAGFDYVDAGLAERDTREVGFSAAVYGEYYPASHTSSYLGRIAYQYGHEGQDETIVCRSVIVKPAEDCVKAAPGPPSSVERLNVSLENRRLLGRLGPGNFAMTPSVTYDVLSDELGAQFNLYYLPDGDLPVAPGIRVGYTSEEDEVTFGIFLRTAFKLF